MYCTRLRPPHSTARHVERAQSQRCQPGTINHHEDPSLKAHPPSPTTPTSSPDPHAVERTRYQHLLTSLSEHHVGTPLQSITLEHPFRASRWNSPAEHHVGNIPVSCSVAMAKGTYLPSSNLLACLPPACQLSCPCFSRHARPPARILNSHDPTYSGQQTAAVAGTDR